MLSWKSAKGCRRKDEVLVFNPAEDMVDVGYLNEHDRGTVFYSALPKDGGTPISQLVPEGRDVLVRSKGFPFKGNSNEWSFAIGAFGREHGGFDPDHENDDGFVFVNQDGLDALLDEIADAEWWDLPVLTIS